MALSHFEKRFENVTICDVHFNFIRYLKAYGITVWHLPSVISFSKKSPRIQAMFVISIFSFYIQA